MSKVYNERKYDVEKTGKYEITLTNEEENIVLNIFEKNGIGLHAIDYFDRIRQFKKNCNNDAASVCIVGKYLFEYRFGKIKIIEGGDNSPEFIVIVEITHGDCIEILNLVLEMESI